MGNQLINKNEIRRCSSPSPPLDTTTVLSSLTRMLPLRLCLTPSWFPPSNPPSTPPSRLRPEMTRPPPSPRPLPSRTSKALTARILKRLDDGQPLVEVARKMKAIEGMQPQINDMERRLGIMQSVEP